MSHPKPRKSADIARVISRRREQVVTAQETWALVRRVLLLAVVGYLLLTQVFLITQVEGQGMFPAVKDGDLAMVYRLQGSYARNDVVAYQAEGQRYFGRIIAQGGDEVQIDTTGTLLVNGLIQTGEILFPTNTRDGESYRYVVPEGCVYVLGDYRTQTVDSRDFGAISLDDVEGKLITILRRRGL
ncbi:MAG: signal peptidase I [Clostridia bacterium]|nr:signal peptidase I [Clostridia bacterium]